MAILAAPVIFLGGCAVRTQGIWGGMSTLTLTPPLLTVVVSNNTRFVLAFEENGYPVMMGDQSGQLVRAHLAPGGTVSRGFYNFMGTRLIVITAKAYCPETGLPARIGTPDIGCTAGQYIGMDSRTFTLSQGQNYMAQDWVIAYIQAARTGAF